MWLQQLPQLLQQRCFVVCIMPHHGPKPAEHSQQRTQISYSSVLLHQTLQFWKAP
jgi:hypothetical protein